MEEREDKPRKTGITLVLDKGFSTREIEDMIDSAGDYIDMVKIGWGTGLVTKKLKEKIDLLHDSKIPVLFGGTMFEYFFIRNEIDSFKKMLGEYKIDMVEISDGTVDILHEEKLDYIHKFSKNYTVMSEIGSKDPNVVIPPYKWIELMESELNAGSRYVVAEARESGKAGICRTSGELRYGLIDEIITKIAPEKIIFEAPSKGLQVWFIKKFGPNVNLGNITPDEIISLETLRLGLRGDTLLHFYKQEK